MKSTDLMIGDCFNYSVITENIMHNNISEITFPTRKEALCFFMAAVKKYN